MIDHPLQCVLTYRGFDVHIRHMYIAIHIDQIPRDVCVLIPSTGVCHDRIFRTIVFSCSILSPDFSKSGQRLHLRSLNGQIDILRLSEFGSMPSVYSGGSTNGQNFTWYRSNQQSEFHEAPETSKHQRIDHPIS